MTGLPVEWQSLSQCFPLSHLEQSPGGAFQWEVLEDVLYSTQNILTHPNYPELASKENKPQRYENMPDVY